MLRKLFIIFALLLTSACQSDYKLSLVKVTPVQESPTSSPVEVIKETPTKSVEPSPIPSASSIVTPEQIGIKDAIKFMYRDSKGVHFKDYASYTSIYTSGDGLAEGTNYSVLPNGNITEGVSGEFQGNYKSGSKVNLLGFLAQMLVSGKVSSIEKVDVDRDKTYNDIIVGDSKFHLDLSSNTLELNGTGIGLISDVCKNSLCYDYTSELRDIFGTEVKLFGRGDNTLGITLGNNSESIPSYIEFSTAYHTDSKHGPDFASVTARVTRIEGSKVFFKLLDGYPFSNQIETSFKQASIVGEGFLEYSKSNSEISVSWGIKPSVATNQLGYITHFSTTYMDISNKQGE